MGSTLRIMVAGAVVGLAGSAAAAPLRLIPAVLHQAPAASSPSAAATAAAPAARDVPPASPASPAGDDLGFDLLGAPAAPAPSALDLKIAHQAQLRETLLTIHQAMGLATLACLAATVLVGQLSYADKFGRAAPNQTDRYVAAHEILSFTTLAGFAATGVLGLTAPVPYPKPTRIDTTLLHKVCMGAAVLGMMTELGLGLYTQSREGYVNQKSLAQVHQAVGLGTLVAMGAGATAFIW